MSAETGTTKRKATGPVYVLRLRAIPGRDGLRGLKAILKLALRRHGLRAISVREEGVTT
jgi:hypothetical protein